MQADERTRYNPDFWEIDVDPAILESTLVAPDFLDQLLTTADDIRAEEERARIKQEAAKQIRLLIHTVLTPQQKRITTLYFDEGMTQAVIARKLGISQQVVSKHLFGVLRDGRRIGGAVEKLRKSAEKLGIDPAK